MENEIMVAPAQDAAVLMAVKQLPIIEERLREKAEEVKAKVAVACSLACTPETVAEVKKVRAALNKEFAEYETARKDIKKAVLAPYEAFESTYKECISNEYRAADLKLKQMVDNTEYHLREVKEKMIRLYYQEHLAAAGLNPADWAFERTGIKVNLSSSDKSLKEAAKAYAEQRATDIRTIGTMADADEIMVEYKRCVDLGQAVLLVKDRHRAAEEARAEREAREVQRLRELATSPETPQEAQWEAVPEAAEPPALEEEPIPAEQEYEDILCLSFKVYGTRAKLKALKQFLIDGGYDYE